MALIHFCSLHGVHIFLETFYMALITLVILKNYMNEQIIALSSYVIN